MNNVRVIMTYSLLTESCNVTLSVANGVAQSRKLLSRAAPVNRLRAVSGSAFRWVAQSGSEWLSRPKIA
jgi:hypothetical protein